MANCVHDFTIAGCHCLLTTLFVEPDSFAVIVCAWIRAKKENGIAKEFSGKECGIGGVTYTLPLIILLVGEKLCHVI